MNKDRFGVIFARMSACAGALRTVIEWIRQDWHSDRVYRPGEHYMRGPGPKWREKHGQDGAASRFAQQPMLLGDKWDF